VISLTFTETVDIVNVQAEEFMLQWKVADTTQSVALTGSTVVADGHIIVNLFPTPTVLNTIKSKYGLADSVTNGVTSGAATSYLSASINAASDTAATANQLKLIATTAAKPAASFTADVRCAFSDRNLHSRMPLDPTHVRLKRTRV
jgi:hypothetical protein